MHIPPVRDFVYPSLLPYPPHLQSSIFAHAMHALLSTNVDMFTFPNNPNSRPPPSSPTLFHVWYRRVNSRGLNPLAPGSVSHLFYLSQCFRCPLWYKTFCIANPPPLPPSLVWGSNHFAPLCNPPSSPTLLHVCMPKYVSRDRSVSSQDGVWEIFQTPGKGGVVWAAPTLTPSSGGFCYLNNNSFTTLT